MTKTTRRDVRILDAQLLRAVTGGGFNQQETLSTNVQKKVDDTVASQRDKV